MSTSSKKAVEAEARFSKARSPKGFTLIELLVVIGIIGILVGIVIGVAGFANRKSANSRALSDLERIKTALEEFRIERGRYFGPASGSVSGAVDSLTVGGERFDVAMSNYLKDLRMIDPWGNAYQYASSSPFSYRLWSMGLSVTSAADDVESGVGNF